VLKPHQVKPFLCHEDRFVREHAMRYFAKSFSRDSELMPLVLESIAKYGDEESFLMIGYARELAQSEISIHTILERLPHTTDINSISNYNAIIAKADVKLLKPLLPKIRKTKNILPETVEKAQRRLVLLPWNTERLWDELFAFSKNNAPKKLNEIDFDYGAYIVEALARKDDVPIAEIINCLKDEEQYYRYDELYLTMLAGEIGMEEAIPILMDKMRIDTYFLCQLAGDSLVKIGTEDVVTTLKKCFPEENFHFKNFSAHIFGAVKTPTAEEALLEIFPKEEDPGLTTFLAEDICYLISEKGIPLVKQLIQDGYETGIVNLRNPLYATCKILGTELEELDEWKKDLLEQERIRKRRMESLTFPRKMPDTPKQNSSHQQKTTTPKVGRNEPCPCGSGKKYKKCCGN